VRTVLPHSATDATPVLQGDVLVLNVGSSSLKFALFPLADDRPPSWRGQIAQLGLGEARLKLGGSSTSEARHETLGQLDHRGALREVLTHAADVLSPGGLVAIGHRVVHGGPHLDGPVLLDGETLDRLHAMDPYDPAHQAIELGYIEEVAKRWPELPQVACFDTTFHRTLPEVAQRLPVSRLDAARGLKRYGFHGLSYTHVVDELRRASGDSLAHGRIVVAHLGSGASLAAVKAGRSVETTMGFTPTGGFPMSSRSGDIDPGVFLWLKRHRDASAEDFFTTMTRQSGLLAISETTSDLSDLLERERSDLRAADAVAFFCYDVRKAIGALAAVLGGLDLLVFTGGIGEHQPVIRERICAGLEFLGVKLDAARNAAGDSIISAREGAVGVRVIPANEEQVIADAVRRLLKSRPPAA